MVFPGVVRRALKLTPAILQALAIITLTHLLGQGILSRFGSARYRFSQNYHGNNAGFGASNKVQTVIKYIDKNIPHYSPKPKKSTTSRAPRSRPTRPSRPTKSTTTTSTSTSTTPPPPPSLEELQVTMKQRVARLRDTCNKYGLGGDSKAAPELIDPEVREMELFMMRQNLPTKPIWQKLYCSKEHHISLCPVFKAASTFLLKKLLLLAPSHKWDKVTVKHLGDQANMLARKEFGYLSSWDKYPEFTSPPSTTAIFVRHPFERILSAFRDKLEDPHVMGRQTNEFYYNKYGRRIVMHYRKEKVTGRSYKYPRFSEFLDYLLDKDLRYDDEHWAPFYKECTPCHINYTFIGHFETLYWDVHLLAHKTDLVELWDDPTDYFQSKTFHEVSREYFGQVEKEVIRSLYKRYKIDFELFGYSPDEYIAMGKPENGEENVEAARTNIRDENYNKPWELGNFGDKIDDGEPMKLDVDNSENENGDIKRADHKKLDTVNLQSQLVKVDHLEESNEKENEPNNVNMLETNVL